jgi:hypothetical protein
MCLIPSGRIAQTFWGNTQGNGRPPRVLLAAVIKIRARQNDPDRPFRGLAHASPALRFTPKPYPAKSTVRIWVTIFPSPRFGAAFGPRP